MPLESFTKKQAPPKPVQETVPVQPAPIPDVQMEKKKTVFEEIAELADKSKDKREGAVSDYAQREVELLEAGVLSSLEKSKFDERITKGPGTIMKLSFRNFFQFPGLIKGDWELADSAERKVWDAKSLAYLVEEGNISRNDYLELLKLKAQNPEAAEARIKELYKGKCDELTALVETPVFAEFIESLDPEMKRYYNEQYEKAFSLYKSGEYEQAVRGLKDMLDGDYPWVSYGKTPLYKMLKMKELGLIGDKEIKRVFGRAERDQLSVYGDKEFSKKLGHFTTLQELRGMGKVNDEELAKHVEAMKVESPPAA